jgi:hypothetical protein
MRAHWVALAAVAVTLSARTAWGYSDDALGYSISIPGGYRQIAISAEEQYIVARWQSEREYYDRREKEDYYYSYRPEIKVVLFDPKGKYSKEKTELGDGLSVVTVNNPYKSYKAWVKSEGEGGRYISKEEETKVNGVPTTWYEVAYEKLTTPRHGLAFVYHAEDIDYCVTTEVLEQDWKKLSGSLLSALRSFKIFPRKGVLKRETAGGGLADVVADAKDDTPEGRFKRRRDSFDRRLSLCRDRLTPGWKVEPSDSGHYVALTHADAKFTNLVLKQADGVREWADEELGYFGDGIPGPEIIRIFKDWDEERAFGDISSHSGGSGGTISVGGSGLGRIRFWAWDSEITLSRREGWWGLGTVAGSIYHRWLRDKNPHFAYALPEWLDRGIDEYVSRAYFKGGKLEFRPDLDTTVALKLAAKQGTLIKVRDLLQMSYKDLQKLQNPGIDNSPRGFSSGAYQQASGFVRYLLAGPGKTNPMTKDLLKTYVKNLDQYIQEREAKPIEETAKDKVKAPETEEEEDKRLKERSDWWSDDTREKELLKAVFDKTFQTWKDSDWAALERSYRTFAD